MSETRANEIGAFENFLKGEIADQQKRNRRATVIGGVAVLAVAIYMAVISNFVCNQVLEPTSAAQWTTYMLQQNGPQVMADVEASLVDHAPEAAAQAMDGIMDIPGVVGQEARQQIDMVADEMLPLLKAELIMTLEAKLEENAPLAAELYGEHSEPEVVKAFVDQLAADVVASLDTELKADSGGQGADHLVQKSLMALRDMDYHLRTLNEKSASEMTREERLHKRLVLLILQTVEDLHLRASADAGGAMLVF